MNIFIDETFFNPNLMEQFKNEFPNFTLLLDPMDYAKIDILIASPKMIQKNIIDQMPNLKFIKLLTAGYDTVDLAYVKQKHIPIAYAKDVFSIQIAEDVFAKILYFNRKLGSYHELSKNHAWTFVPSRHEIYGQTVLILGAGSIGNEIAVRMKAFGATVIGYKKRPLQDHLYDAMVYDMIHLKQVLRITDYVIVCLSLSKETYHFVNEDFLQSMHKDALLINIARGDIIDQQALIDALNKDIIRGAALDVTSPEPLLPTDPLWQAKNIFITPHQASSSPMMKKRLMNEVMETMKNYIEGNPLSNLIP
ncbi:MAG: D-2-hydroxyacid dehydrogenase [Acholeplasma sp.]|jgi:phosphoglycerate dehydrogenase-like enzyme|nr:MAG: D-2-hydroxyacid dehydrogenase [Acholeplasma sp.]